MTTYAVDVPEIDAMLDHGPWYRDEKGARYTHMYRNELVELKKLLFYERNLRFSREATLLAVQDERRQIETAYNKLQQRIVPDSRNPTNYRDHFRDPSEVK